MRFGRSGRRRLPARRSVPRDFGRRRGPRTWRRTAAIVAAAGAFGAACAGIVLVAPIVADLPLFTISVVSVRGNECLSSDEVREFAGILPGTSLLRLPRAEALGRLRQHPRIERAVVAVRPWSEVVILVTERRPLALLAAGDVREIAADGRVLPAAHGRFPKDAPLLTGFRGADDPRLADALRLVGWLAEEEPQLHDALSEVRPDSGQALSAYLTSGHFWVRIPTPVDRARERLRWLRTVTNDLMVRGVAGAVVDLGYEGQIVVRPHPAWAAAADSAYAPPEERAEGGQENRENRRGA